MSDTPHISNRENIIEALKAELFGPRPHGREINCTGRILLDSKNESYDSHVQKGNGEEILTSEYPLTRYGVGVLNPEDLALDPVTEDTSDSEGESPIPSGDQEKRQPEIEKLGSDSGEGDSDDFDLSMTNASRMCSMAISFLAEIRNDAQINIIVTGGRYRAREVNVSDGTRNSPWWLREPIELCYTPSAEILRVDSAQRVTLQPNRSANTEGLNLNLEVLTRPQGNDQYLLTVSLVNRTSLDESELRKAEACLFQSRFNVSISTQSGAPRILPYPENRRVRPEDAKSERERAALEEEESLNFLYRKARTYAVGHGCAADWKKTDRSSENAYQVIADPLPIFETRSITPDIRREDGTELKVSMVALAGLDENDNGMDALDELVDLYENWIDDQTSKIGELAARYRPAAKRHMRRARRCADRMREGIDLLREDSTARRAFRLANHAILLQQIRSFREARSLSYNQENGRIRASFSSEHPNPDPRNPGPNRGKWRAFQIAFLLMALPSTADGEHIDREVVELIWFPTGGGKTEAYLGLAAFSIFLRYLRDPEDHGTHVLMRYTLRLLTAQQFQRASRLICAMEYLRRRKLEDVQSPISIGIWLGGSTSPNTRNQARRNLKKLKRNKRNAQNKFVVTQCPWCGAQMGPINSKYKRAPNVVGYETDADTVQFSCPDPDCEFAQRNLPIYVIDDDVYENRPDLVIGTVDKFAMLAWRPQARALFGLEEDGSRMASPPGLIIQDELHLISGPLGSMVGLYEGLIEELCTKDEEAIRPKIVSSTATIRRYEDQIRDLYARDSVTLFPPPGLEQGDSFFARYAIKDDGTFHRGKKYIGIYAPGLPSMQTTQVRTFSSLLAAPSDMSATEQDPWWTLLIFYNSLRELGGALSLFQSDIPEYLRGLQQRLDVEDRRYVNRVLELTGRISGEEVAKAISKLETTTSGNGKAIDACLASSIIEVGVDIDRLSLMSVVGQPKTTSQYIQVTGRVGRRWKERPGIVTTLYSASKPRDRSHYEKFRSYHERLYAQVEPTSATPFSPPALDRALHAVMVAYIRQLERKNLSPYPPPSRSLEDLHEILRDRVERIDEDELENFERVFKRRIREWKKWERTHWTSDEEDPGIMYQAGSYVPQDHRDVSWAVPMSMRNVDAECQIEIQIPYDSGE